MKSVCHKIVLEEGVGQMLTKDGEGGSRLQSSPSRPDFNLAEMDLTEVARGGPALTPLKATESKSKFNEAQPS